MSHPKACPGGCNGTGLVEHPAGNIGDQRYQRTEICPIDIAAGARPSGPADARQALQPETPAR